MHPSIRGTIAAVVIAALFVLPAFAAPQAQEPQAIITSPTDGQPVSGFIDIFGTVTAPDFSRYEISFVTDPNPADPNPPPDGWVPFAIADIVLTDAQIGLWDTSPLPDGTYALRLQVFRSDGGVVAQTFVRGLVKGTPPPATPEATPSSVPPAPTFEEESAPIEPTIVIEQPPTPTPQPTVAAAGAVDSDDTSSSRRIETPTIDLSRFGSACVNGIWCAVGAYLLLAFFVSGRWGLRWVIRQARSATTRQAYEKSEQQTFEE